MIAQYVYALHSKKNKWALFRVNTYHDSNIHICEGCGCYMMLTTLHYLFLCCIPGKKLIKFRHQCLLEGGVFLCSTELRQWLQSNRGEMSIKLLRFPFLNWQELLQVQEDDTHSFNKLAPILPHRQQEVQVGGYRVKVSEQV